MAVPEISFSPFPEKLPAGWTAQTKVSTSDEYLRYANGTWEGSCGGPSSSSTHFARFVYSDLDLRADEEVRVDWAFDLAADFYENQKSYGDSFRFEHWDGSRARRFALKWQPDGSFRVERQMDNTSPSEFNGILPLHRPIAGKVNRYFVRLILSQQDGKAYTEVWSDIGSGWYWEGKTTEHNVSNLGPTWTGNMNRIRCLLDGFSKLGSEDVVKARTVWLRTGANLPLPGGEPEPTPEPEPDPCAAYEEQLAAVTANWNLALAERDKLQSEVWSLNDRIARAVAVLEQT